MDLTVKKKTTLTAVQRGKGPTPESPWPPRYTDAQRAEIRRLTSDLETLVLRMEERMNACNPLHERLQRIVAQGKAEQDTAKQAALRETWRQVNAEYDAKLADWRQVNEEYMSTHASLWNLLAAIPGAGRVHCPACREERGTPMTGEAILSYGMPCAEHAKPILLGRTQVQGE